MDSKVGSELTVDTEDSQAAFGLGPRFVDLHPVGYGVSGLVFGATDSECDKKVAIKKLSFRDRSKCIQALREVRIMRRLEHDNILTVYEVLDNAGAPLTYSGVAGGSDGPTSIFIVQQLMDMDVGQLAATGQLTPAHVQLLIYQLLRGLKYIHSANVLHRDLKPSNLLINCEDLVLKIADFGAARIVDPEYDHKGFLTERVGTCWYRAPEQIINPQTYTEAVDMWSCGCILAELLLGHPLFPAAHELDLLRLTLDHLHLTENDWDAVMAIMPNKMLKNHPLRALEPLSQLLPDADPNVVDLLEKLLAFSPEDRLSAKEALAHPYFAGYSCPWDEPSAARPLHIENEVDNVDMDILVHLLEGEFSQGYSGCGNTITPECFCEEDLVRSETLTADDTLTLEEIMNISFESQQSCGNVQGERMLNEINLQRSDSNAIEHFLNILNLQDDEKEEDTAEGKEIYVDEEATSAWCHSYLETSTTPVRPSILCRSIANIDEIDDNHRASNGSTVGQKAAVSSLPLSADDSICLEATSRSAQVLSELEKEQISDSPDKRPPTLADWAVASCQSAGLPHRHASSHHRCSRSSPVMDTISEANVTADDDEDGENLKERLVAEKSPTRRKNRRYSGKELEKDKNIRVKSRHKVINSNAYDEMYRLPTAHLNRDRDFSNERLKNRPNGFQTRSHSNNRLNEEINERLKEERINGACGGDGMTNDGSHGENMGADGRCTESYLMLEHGGLLLNRHFENELRNHHLTGTRVELHNSQLSHARLEVTGPHLQLSSTRVELANSRVEITNGGRGTCLQLTAPSGCLSDSSSSPDRPSSPRPVHSGARPKRSPRKQKHRAL